ncbi:MAG: hypothetical protein GY953_20730 [bacterium]|nr:hypothetical protein [bacterium]
MAPKPDTAILAARCLPGVTLIAPGEEAVRLGVIPLDRVPMEEQLLDTLQSWGLKTLDDVGELPPIGLAERLGEEGVRLYQLARGQNERPLELAPPATSYTEEIELGYEAEQLEPLLFLLARLLTELCQRLVSHSMATNRLTLELSLRDEEPHRRVLELPIPQNNAQTLLKLLQLDLEAHPPLAAVTAMRLTVNPVEPRHDQGGLFLPEAPAPEKLQITLARIENLVGEENVGSPSLLDTHRPDAFRMRTFAPPRPEPSAPRGQDVSLSLWLFRPSLPAEVRIKMHTPNYVAASGVRGGVRRATGPWRNSGDWWRETAWARDEWDVALTDGGLYRIFLDTRAEEWFVEGVYD